MTKDAAYWIEKLALEAHPEGGYYQQTYKADLILAKEKFAAGVYRRAGGLDRDLFSIRGREFFRVSPLALR